ncbi:fimbrial protein [Pseudomonas sp. RA_105y_Pfl2_P56]|uniref:fimbrial protein n=1 Tax=Pseudomonas sp. RA_105y_Pfl2_P56 TaxID=3088701 RepID=UPI0030D9F517
MFTRLIFWGAVHCAAALYPAQASWAADTTQLEISGTLIKPPCTASFPLTQSVEVPKVNLNSLRAGVTDWTDVALNFQCTKGSRVQITFTSGRGAFDSGTMRTTSNQLGLATRLSDVTTTVRPLEMNFGEPQIFAVKDAALNLKFSVRPVIASEQLPTLGTFSATLMMEVVYL